MPTALRRGNWPGWNLSADTAAQSIYNNDIPPQLYNQVMELPEEAFPDVKHLFQQAFAAEDPAPPLLHLLKEHTTFSLRDLVFYYTQAVHDNPYRGQILASAVARMIRSHDAPSSGQDRLSRELAGTLFKDWYDDDTAKVYGPKNTYLLDSLLSGFSLKYELTVSPEIHGAIEDGLKAKPGSKESELLVVGTCIQLLLHGLHITTHMAGTYQRNPKKVAKELQAHQNSGTVKDPRAIEVLKLTITHAETGLLQENERDDVWSLLFPPKA